MILSTVCPVCRHPLPWTFVLRPIWSQWRCTMCGSLLEINTTRRLLMLIPFAAVLLLSISLASAIGVHTTWVLAFVTLLALIPIVLQPPRVIERCGFRCKTCGYDLQGQVVPRCPECGRELDPGGCQILGTGAYPAPTNRRPSRLGTILLLIVIVVLGWSVAVVLYKTTRFTPKPAPASQPGAPPASRG
ncbi:MAG: hypothetical protein KJ749_04520 [Planctomycetes bacterium]|nr:hypothetical protein [Planctomycetota bacterium]